MSAGTAIRRASASPSTTVAGGTDAAGSSHRRGGAPCRGRRRVRARPSNGDHDPAQGRAEAACLLRVAGLWLRPRPHARRAAARAAAPVSEALDGSRRREPDRVPAGADGGRLFLGTNHGLVLAVDASTGRVVWKRQFAGCVAASPAVGNGIVYLGFMDPPPCRGTAPSFLAALDTRTGRTLWRFRAGVVETPPLLA